MESAKVHNRRVVNKSTGEVSVRPAVPVSAVSATSLSKESEGSSDALDKSLSSAFFQNLRKGSDPHAAQVNFECIELPIGVRILKVLFSFISQRGDNLLPPPPGNPGATTQAFVDEATAELLAKERKKRDTAAAVAQSQDAVQAAWPIVWRKLRTLRDPAKLRPWLVTVAANEARQILHLKGRDAVAF